MLFNVPQFVNIEDKIVGPFTAKQLGWLVVGGVILLILFKTLTTGTFIVTGIFVVGIFGALAFYRPYNQSLIKFIMSGIYFFFHPKMYVWKRNYAKIKKASEHSEHKVTKKVNQTKIKKILTAKKIEEISNHLNVGE